jgi:hypothetical protein
MSKTAHPPQFIFAETARATLVVGAHSSSCRAASLTPLQPLDNLVINTVDGRGEVPISELGTTAADDEIAIGEGIGIMIDHHVPPRSKSYLNHPEATPIRRANINIVGGAGRWFCRTDRPAPVLAPNFITCKFCQPSKLFPLMRVSDVPYR